MSGIEVWLVRHGATEWSESGRHTGTTDIPLTEAGREAAVTLGQRLSGHDFARVLTSPLQRARQTCELAGLGASAKVVDDLREWEYGDYEGLTTAQVRESRPGWTVWADGCPGGEVADEVGARVDRVIATLLASDGDVVVFGHGHCLRVLAARWVGLPARDGALLALDTAGLSILGWEREQRVVRLWNRPA